MIGGGRGGGGGGGIIGDRLAWEVLLFPFKPGEWSAVLVTNGLTWFPQKRETNKICYNNYLLSRNKPPHKYQTRLIYVLYADLNYEVKH